MVRSKIGTVAQALLPILLLVGLTASFLGIETTAASRPEDAAQVMEIRPHAAGSPAALVERHHCWTGAAPAGVTVPGHVVVTRDGRTVYGGARLVDQALGQIFDGEAHGLTIHGFCR